MAFPYLHHDVPHDSAAYFGQTQARMRDDIESLRRSVLGSRRSIAEGLESIARANEVLAWRMSERHKCTREDR